MKKFRVTTKAELENCFTFYDKPDSDAVSSNEKKSRIFWNTFVILMQNQFIKSISKLQINSKLLRTFETNTKIGRIEIPKLCTYSTNKSEKTIKIQYM